MSCCDYECNQAHDCPVRPAAYPRHCETSKQPCVQPYTCAQQCVIDIAKLQRPARTAPPRPRRASRLWWLLPVAAFAGFLIFRSLI